MISTALPWIAISERRNWLQRAESARACWQWQSGRSGRPPARRRRSRGALRAAVSSTERNGLRIRDVKTLVSSCSSSARQLVVLPVPMSPVRTMKPSLRRMACWRRVMALFVRFAAVEEPWIRRQREWRLHEAVILLVHRCVTGLRGDLGCHAARNITDQRL